MCARSRVRTGEKLKINSIVLLNHKYLMALNDATRRHDKHHADEGRMEGIFWWLVG
jgi:hypothetical protein